MSVYSQNLQQIKCEWGPEGVKETAQFTDTFVVVDVLSFSTCVSIGCLQGAEIYPFTWKDERSGQYAKDLGAELAGKRGSESKFNLSPSSLRGLKRSQKLVLPSPNGSLLSTLTDGIETIAGCLRNAGSVADYLNVKGGRVTLIPGGERWERNDSLRPSLEDQIGAGAIISRLSGAKSPEAIAAQAVYREFEMKILSTLQECSSGRELIEKGYPDDVLLAAQQDCDSVIPRLTDGRFVSRV